MLDADIKRTINNARDILVGKIPNPQGQVDLITIAMIYKFMDDMDLQNVEDSGKRIFFTSELKQYAFSKLLGPKIGAQVRMNLYTEALDKLPLATNIPELFRTIFKGAFLPFRDPATLTLFLKEIANFSYDNSETLGNAFEYLLSIMGSQGDAGQFRTPRHIIDFIVNVVKPTKDDSILDPACGTAGFLISAFKHIMAQNAKTQLTPKEMKALTNNIVGYDISPDMRKLALVNLYLHRFTDPKIYEYDTLTSEERWGDRFDVILANPPFMTPKGGIIPHNKFSMKANRAEVLFVDYIMEHLTLNGRAGVIVPEGIIFQSATAHKALRKLLVDENYLYAVVSLPGGVFNPYAGVKTSILFMDKQIAKRSKDILFVKIDNDGFDLGAQRRPINANDLPEAVQIIENWKAGKDITAAPNASVVSKEAIKGDGDYNLTAGRYIASEAFENCKYAMVKLGEVCEFKRGESITKKDITDGTIPVIAGGQTPAYYHNKANRTGEIITVSASGAYSGFVSFYDIPIFVSDAFTIKPSTESLNIRYLYSLLKGKQQLIYSFQAGGGIPHVHAKDLVNLEIPLPPLEVQKKIVDEIENKQSAINHARQIIENLERERHYLAGLLDGIEYQEVALGDIAKVQYGFTDTAKDEGDARFIRITDIDEDGSLRNSDAKYITLNDNNRKYLLKDGDILVARTGATYGKTLLFKGNASSIYASFLIKLDFDNAKILNTYYWCFAQSKLYWEQAQNLASGGGQPQFNGNAMVNIRIPLPSLADQEKIVAAMEEEQAIITANKSLIDLMDKKIHNVIQRIYKTE